MIADKALSCREATQSSGKRRAISLPAAATLTIIPPTMKLRRHKKDFGVLYAALVLFGQHPATRAADSQSEHAKVRIIADVQSIEPGEPFEVGIHFDIEEGWHLNWINPGDAGLAPSIGWKLPDGFRVGELEWPYPRAYRIGPLVIYGYDEELLLTTRVTPPADLPAGGRVDIGASVGWLACAEACVPGSAEVATSLPVRSSLPPPDDRWRSAFEKARDQSPMPPDGWRVQAFVEDERRYLLEVRSSDPKGEPIAGCRFFPLDPGVIENAQPQRFSALRGGFDLSLTRAYMSTGIPDRIRGVLVAEPGWDLSGKRRAISFDVPLERR
jgi:DsbC/DsbD-like thiol-disulfide interchange protein